MRCESVHTKLGTNQQTDAIELEILGEVSTLFTTHFRYTEVCAH